MIEEFLLVCDCDFCLFGYVCDLFAFLQSFSTDSFTTCATILSLRAEQRFFHDSRLANHRSSDLYVPNRVSTRRRTAELSSPCLKFFVSGNLKKIAKNSMNG